jgi:hypothetical protein
MLKEICLVLLFIILLIIIAVLYCKIKLNAEILQRTRLQNNISKDGGGGNDELVKKIIAARTPEKRKIDASTPDWLKELILEAGDNSADIEKEVLNLESRIGESVKYIDPISGNLDFRFTDEQIQTIIKNKLLDFRQRGILVTKEEFAKEDLNKWHRQRAINLQTSMEHPDNSMADITRILGADYLRDIFNKNLDKSLAVPNYRLVVDNIQNIKTVVTCDKKYGLVFYGVQGVIYAEKIIGKPAMKEITDSVKNAATTKGINIAPGNRGFYESTHQLYPDIQADVGKILIGTRWEDYGAGLGPTYWDNVIYSDKNYFIDTELKSFHILYEDDKLGEYMRERFMASRGSEYKSKFDTRFSITLPIYFFNRVASRPY